jgi:transposase
MKDEQKIAQAKRMEELIVYLKTTTRELAKLAGVHENTLYKICCAHNTISNRTAARICFNVEKHLGIVINRQWLINGEGSMLDDKLSTPPPYKSDEDEQLSPMVAEEDDPYDINWKDKYYALLEKYTDLLENKA